MNLTKRINELLVDLSKCERPSVSQFSEVLQANIRRELETKVRRFDYVVGLPSKTIPLSTTISVEKSYFVETRWDVVQRAVKILIETVKEMSIIRRAFWYDNLFVRIDTGLTMNSEVTLTVEWDVYTDEANDIEIMKKEAYLL